MKPKAALTAGVVVLAAAWLGPQPSLTVHAFTAHMTTHLAVVAVAAPLLAWGVAGGAFDPVRVAPRLFSPVVASIAEFAVVWAWHAPALHHAARRDPLVFVLEQITFLLAGLWLWLAVFGGEAQVRLARAATGVVVLLLTSMHMTLLGALLSLAPRSLYGATHGSAQLDGWAPALASANPLSDQQLGGALMLLVGGSVYLLGGLWLMVDLVRTVAPAARERA
jgi:putative membrane protein